MIKTNKVIVIVSRGDKSVRVSYNPFRPKDGVKHKVVESEWAGDFGALCMLNHTLEQFLQDGFSQPVTIVTHEDTAIRAYEYRKCVRDDENPRDVLVKEWMIESEAPFAEEIQYFCDLMEQMNSSIYFTPIHNIYMWRFTQCSDEIKEGDTLAFKDGIEATKALATLEAPISTSGTVLRYNGALGIARRENPHIKNMKAALDFAWKQCPVLDLEFSDLELCEGF